MKLGSQWVHIMLVGQAKELDGVLRTMGSLWLLLAQPF